jgi:hypothetical protein
VYSAVDHKHFGLGSELDLSLEEYQEWNSKIPVNLNKGTNKETPYIKQSIDGGEKMSAWLKLVNTERSNETVIRLTSRATQRGIPIHAPSIYGPATIKRDYLKLNLDMPKALSEVIYGSGAISKKLPVTDDVFILWARKTSKLYQTSVRWKGMQPWLDDLEARGTRDVRGFYLLKNLKDLDYSLDNIDAVTLEEASKIKTALAGICINATAYRKRCPKDVEKAFLNKKLREFKNKYWEKAQKNWDRFFLISNPRKDITWKKNAPNTMHVEFKKIKNSTVQTWLKENVEDEFKMDNLGWNLEMSFIKGRVWGGTAYLEFQPNVTPHVSGGNKIVMDANTPLEEYGVKWTIRHEYGHILRIPDCYHEFYDRANNQMINYQLDITDLMCSRVGQMNERIYNELKRVYLK